MNAINKALDETEYEAVAYDNTGIWLNVIIDKKQKYWEGDEMEELNMDTYYMQFCVKVLDIVKTAEQSLTEEEYCEFLKSVKGLIDEKIG